MWWWCWPYNGPDSSDNSHYKFPHGIFTSWRDVKSQGTMQNQPRNTPESITKLTDIKVSKAWKQMSTIGLELATPGKKHHIHISHGGVLFLINPGTSFLTLFCTVFAATNYTDHAHFNFEPFSQYSLKFENIVLYTNFLLCELSKQCVPLSI